MAFFEWGVKHIDLVEINNKGIEDMNTLFAENRISSDRYTIIKSMIENYESNKKYDIIIAESFFQFVHNQQEIIDILRSV